MAISVRSNRTGGHLFSFDTPLSDGLCLSPEDARRLLEFLHSIGDSSVVITMRGREPVPATALFGGRIAASIAIS